MAKFPKRGSPGCILLLVEIFLLLPIGLVFSTFGVLSISEGETNGGALLLGIGVFVILFALAAIRETLNRDSYSAVSLPQDPEEATKLTPRELRFLNEIAREVFHAPSDDDALATLRGNAPGTMETANSKLQPIAFTLKPTTLGRYIKGVALEVCTWAIVIISAPVLLFIAIVDAAIAFDLGKGILYKAMRASRRARRYRIRPHNIFLHDDRPPILYLRAFSEEYSESREGFFPRTPEERLADFQEEYGPVIAVGDPAEEIPLLGASRIYFDSANWKAGILYLMSVSQLVIIHAGFAPGLLWELGVARQRLKPERLRISFIAWSDIDPLTRQTHYLRFKKYVEQLLDWELPAEIGNKQYISFESDWKSKDG